MKSLDSQHETLTFLNHTVQVIRKSRRRHITLSMHPDRPLRVQSNLLASPAQILEFLMSKKAWIEKNLSQFESVRQQFQVPDFKPGALFPFLGEMKYLQFEETSLKSLFFKIEEGFLVCYMPRNQSRDQIPLEVAFAKLAQFYRLQAEIFLTSRVKFWTDQTGLVPAKVSFRAQKTRWGSCSSRRHISLNWKLICQAPQLIDYVIVHELCHLAHLNHSDRFWQLLESFLPNYSETEKILKSHERLGLFLK